MTWRTSLAVPPEYFEVSENWLLYGDEAVPSPDRLVRIERKLDDLLAIFRPPEGAEDPGAPGPALRCPSK